MISARLVNGRAGAGSRCAGTDPPRVTLAGRGEALSRLAPKERISVNLEPPGILLAVGSAESVGRRADPHVDETDFLHDRPPAFARKATGNSSGPKIDVLDGRSGDRLAVGNVGELQMSARAQYAPDLLEHLLLVDAQVDDAIADDDVGPAILHRHLLQQALPELDLIETHRRGRGARLGEHFRQHVDANHPSAGSQLLCRDEAIEAG